MRIYGLIGWPLGHSFSKKYFSEKFEREGISDVRYELFPLEKIEDLPALLSEKPELCGLNVTIPHKESVIPYLDELDDTAAEAGAVNCIRIEGGRLKGYNTDVAGFEASLKDFFSTETPFRSGEVACILGTGGAAKAVAYVFRKHGIPFYYVSRLPEAENTIGYGDLISLSPKLLVNATPVGTFPHVDEMPPLPLEMLHSGQKVYDLIYNPAETVLLREAKSRGCTVQNGLEMLHLQAEAAWKIWEGR